jgi:carboxyvinyl-carboxyphosphonate phosphorylmutase
MKKTTLLRNLLKSGRIVAAPGAYNALTAKIVELVGFDAVYVTGYGTSLTLLGEPDIGFVSRPEMVGTARNIVNAVSIPVVSDADTGYGNALNVRRTVREFENVGVAAIHIEDQVWPKRCGHVAGKMVVSREEMVGKIRAACDARVDEDFVIIARTDAIAVEGFEAAIERGRAYVEAGADMLFFDAPTSREQLEQIAGTFDVPLLVNMAEGGRTPQFTIQELGEMGFSLVIFPGTTLAATIEACFSILNELKEKGTAMEQIKKMGKVAEFTLSLWKEVFDLERKYA